MEDAKTATDKLLDLIEEFTNCVICTCYLSEAQECSQCHKLFCKSCIADWLHSTRSESCPSCRSHSRFSSNIPIQRLVDEIPLTCIHKINGCPTCPTRKDFQAHIRTCEYKNRLHLTANFQERTINFHVMIHQNPMVAEAYIRQLFASLANSVRETAPTAAVTTLAAAISVSDTGSDNGNEAMKAELTVRLADCLVAQAKYSEARHIYNETLQKLLVSHGENHELVVCCYAGLGSVNKKLAAYTEATNSIQKAMQIAKTLAGGDSHPEIVPQMITLADILRKVGKFDQAEALYVEAVAKIQRLVTVTAALETRSPLGLPPQALGAAALETRALSGPLLRTLGAAALKTSAPSSLPPQALGAADVRPATETQLNMAAACRGLGLIYKKRALYDDALRWHTQAFEILTAMITASNAAGAATVGTAIGGGSNQHMELGNCLLDLGDVYRKREQHGEALAAYSRAVAHLATTSGLKSADVAEVYYCQSLSYLALQRDKEAFETVDKARLIYEATYGQRHYKLGMVKTVLAKIYSLRAEYQTAQRLFEAAIQELTQELGADHLEVADTHSDIVDCLLKQIVEHDGREGSVVSREIAVQHLNSARDVYIRQLGINHTKVSQCDSRLYIVQQNAF